MNIKKSVRNIKKSIRKTTGKESYIKDAKDIIDDVKGDIHKRTKKLKNTAHEATQH